ncbi:MAG: dicarboxylate/amino acid:cation symporter [Defluviitaleaceae bacterium]|nr:dicarboxylate/amino acid:cation symporter [Defluviitaleaceae bacterium]
MKMGLLTRLLIGIAVGIALGLTGIEFIMRVYATFTSLFGTFLVFSIPLIVMGFLIPGIAEIGNKAGRTVGLVVGFSYFLTVTAGFIAYYAVVAFSGVIVGAAADLGGYRDPATPFLTLAVPPIMGIMSALVFSFIVGIFMTTIEGENTLKAVALNFQHVIKQLVHKVVIPLLPIHISGLFASMAYEGMIVEAMGVFFRLFLLIIIMHIAFLIALYAIAASLYKTNPFRLMKIMLPTYVTALGTQSSMATMPVNYINLKKIGLNQKVAEFIVPFGATILLPGSTMSIVACAVVVMFMFNAEVSVFIVAPFIFMLAITMVAAPGVPGGAIMAALGALEVSLGFSEPMMAIMIALYFAQDSFGTAVNISSDGAVALYLNKYMGNHELVPQEVDI